MRQKFGLLKVVDEDSTLINDFLQLLYTNKRDYHRSIRKLSDQKEQSMGSKFDAWFERYHKRIKQEIEKPEQRIQLMNSVNPKYIFRNYLAEIAIRKAEDLNQYDEIETLFNLLKSPFESHKGFDSYDSEPPEWAQNLELSCSS